MIDVHSHVIPFVDDGSISTDVSLKMLKDEVLQGVDCVICTPHYRKGSFVTPDDEVVSNFERLKIAAKDAGIDVRLLLGREITYGKETKKLISDGNFITLADSKFVLIEFPFTYTVDIDEACYEIKVLGYTPVVAHVERYEYFRDYDAVAAVRRGGALIQVNATALAGKSSPKENRFVKGLFKRELIDLVGSDIHQTRVNYMAEAYKKTSKKNSAYADKIFNENAKIITDESPL